MADDLLRYVVQAGPDILCLQEVIHGPATQEAWLTYRDRTHVLPQRANFFCGCVWSLARSCGVFLSRSAGCALAR
ncbi:hypothetical protein [Sulfitobacter sp. S190]|uniref:hypothetical protein n=1 Tax=Sulfitobacter sp. S190 TaxID=2867022 RepID=UPI0021A8C7EC|nr:hypothetical protein [Sulfitobacter sp. S190]